MMLKKYFIIKLKIFIALVMSISFAYGQNCGNPTVENQCRGNSGEFVLTINNALGTNFNWYTDASGNTLAPGNSEGVVSYKTPYLFESTTYYAQYMGQVSVLGETLQRSSVIWSGSGIIDYDSDDKRARLTVTQSTTLQCVAVYVAANSPGSDVVIRILNSDGTNVIGTKAFTGVAEGRQELCDIGINLNVGEYIIDAMGTTAYLEFEAWDEASRDPDVSYSYPYSTSDGSVTLSNIASWKNLGYGPIYALQFGDYFPEPCPVIAIEANIDAACDIPNSLPEVELVVPSSTLYANQLVTFYASASDCDGSISAVSFYVDGDLVGTTSDYPYYFNWQPSASGIYTISARATDNQTGIGYSEEYTINVRPANTGEGAYYTGEYRNLFTEVLGKTQAEVDQKVASVYSTIMGSSNSPGVFVANGNMGYIINPNDEDVRSEGMSYGMMAAVQMDDKTKFDQIWNWAREYMWYKSGNWDGFFSWQHNYDGSVKGATNASDGEAYFAMALFFAGHRWGVQSYIDDANTILEKVQNKNGTGSVFPLFHTTHKQICFVSYGDSYDHSNPSYHLPGFWELWADWATTNNDFWRDAADISRDHLYNNSNTSTVGLFSDYSNYNGTRRDGQYYNTYNQEDFEVDAWRCVMNVGMDYHWFKKDSRQVDMMTKFLNFFNSERDANGQYYGAYSANGGNSSRDRYKGQVGIISCNGVAPFAVDDESITHQFVQDLWNVSPATDHHRYYHNMLYVLATLNASGNMKIWFPNGTSAPDGAGGTPGETILTANIMVGGSLSICQGDELVLVANAGDGYTYQWKRNGTNISNATSQHYLVSQAGSYTVVVSNSTDSQESTAVVTTVQNVPSAPSVSSPLLLDINSIPNQLEATGSNLRWFGSDVCGVGAENAPIPNTTAEGSTSYYVSQVEDGCESERVELVVNVVNATNSQTISLDMGWNLVSISIIPSSTSIVDVVSCADVVKNDEGFFIEGQAEFLNGITDIVPGQGYLIHTSIVCNIDIEGANVSLNSTDLKEGWNIIGYPFVEQQDIETALSSIIDNVEIIKDFDGFWSYNSGVNSLTDLVPGKAYFVKVTQDCTITW
jgi:endo-1,4-beta-D-glucanase Y